MNKFKNIPSASKDTKILFHNIRTLAGFDVRFETWCWEGFTANSIIFDSKDVSHLSDDEVKSIVKNSDFMELDSDITFQRTEEGFTFVNFNFHHDDL